MSGDSSYGWAETWAGLKKSPGSPPVDGPKHGLGTKMSLYVDGLVRAVGGSIDGPLALDC